MKYNIYVTINKNNNIICIKDRTRRTFIKTFNIDETLNDFINKNHSNDSEGCVKFFYVK